MESNFPASTLFIYMVANGSYCKLLTRTSTGSWIKYLRIHTTSKDLSAQKKFLLLMLL